ncbi:glia-derived nexin [Engraulis encrasicolus]|uniref:glia-derived nexin n=1 Tax=Engraulis encrasicolus TaxID=184585 RepID=UPI002FD608BB
MAVRRFVSVCVSVALLLLAGVCVCEPQPPPQDPPAGAGAGAWTPSYGERGSDVGLAVLRQLLSAAPQGNSLVSPHGTASVLGMLLSGAHGNTRSQLINALKYKKNGPYKMLRKLHKVLTARANGDMVLIANGLFSQSGFSMKPEFLSANRENFLCESHALDFSQSQEAVSAINAWVNNRTRGHIPSLVSAEMLDAALTRLVVVNTIFFKGQWKSRFPLQNTRPRPFTRADGTTTKVPMMSQLAIFNIGLMSTPEGVKYKVIELPYHGDSLSMLIALPAEDETPLAAILPHISTEAIQSWTNQMAQRKMRLLLPKFTVEAEVDLEAPLRALGITDMFNQAAADFRHLSEEPVFVSKALQKAKIEVNEEGTKAAAATTAILLARSSPPWVSVDRPFLFLLRHNPTGTILFAGHINEP